MIPCMERGKTIRLCEAGVGGMLSISEWTPSQPSGGSFPSSAGHPHLTLPMLSRHPSQLHFQLLDGTLHAPHQAFDPSSLDPCCSCFLKDSELLHRIHCRHFLAEHFLCDIVGNTYVSVSIQVSIVHTLLAYHDVPSIATSSSSKKPPSPAVLL